MSDVSTEKVEFVDSCGNVFADLGLSHPDERMAKAELAYAISQRIRAYNLNQTEAAALLETDAIHLADLMRGRLTGFTYDCLLRFLSLLGFDVHITLEPITDKKPGQILVTTQAA